jgi:sugar phosphate permease
MSDAAQKQSTPPRIRRAQTVALALLMVSSVVNYLERGTLAVANPLTRAELGLSVGEMGLLLSAFLWSYAPCQLPVGGLHDTGRTRREQYERYRLHFGRDLSGQRGDRFIVGAGDGRGTVQ